MKDGSDNGGVVVAIGLILILLLLLEAWESTT
jgi:hypothetical protein